MNHLYAYCKMIKTAIAGLLLCGVVSMWGQCSDGTCVFHHLELNSTYTFKYSASVINDQPKETFAGGKLVDADFSRKNGILKVNLYGLQVESPASPKQVFIRTKQIWISSGPEFKKPEEIKLLPEGERSSIELKFQAIPNSTNGRGQIRIEWTVVVDGREIVFDIGNRRFLIINYDFKSFREDVDPSSIGKSDLIKEKLAELDIKVMNKKADKATQWFLPYLDAYDGTSDPRLKAPLENRLEGCCKELYEESKTVPKLEEFIRLYNVGHRLNCEAFGGFISKANKKLEGLSSSPKTITLPLDHPDLPSVSLTKLDHQRFRIEIERADPPYELWYKAYTEEAYLPEHTFVLPEKEPDQRVFELTRADLKGLNAEHLTISIRKSEGNAAIGQEMELDFRLPPSPYPRWLTHLGWIVAGLLALLLLLGKTLRRWILTDPTLRVLFRVPHNKWK